MLQLRSFSSRPWVVAAVGLLLAAAITIPFFFVAGRGARLAVALPICLAAAIAAVGLLNLSNLSPDAVRTAAYQNAALTIVDALSQPPYLAGDDPQWDGILKRGVYHIHKNLGVDESVMWGEFFFVEALVKSLSILNRL